MSKMLILTTAALAVPLYALVPAAIAAPPGFETETTDTQGMSGKPAKDNGNEGTTTTETTGPKGALKNDKDTPNQETGVTDYPGANR
jgi:hypothetical protein